MSANSDLAVKVPGTSFEVSAYSNANGDLVISISARGEWSLGRLIFKDLCKYQYGDLDRIRIGDCLFEPMLPPRK